MSDVGKDFCILHSLLDPRENNALRSVRFAKTLVYTFRRDPQYNYNLDFVASTNVAAAEANTTESRSLVLAAIHNGISSSLR